MKVNYWLFVVPRLLDQGTTGRNQNCTTRNSNYSVATAFFYQTPTTKRAHQTTAATQFSDQLMKFYFACDRISVSPYTIVVSQ